MSNSAHDSCREAVYRGESKIDLFGLKKRNRYHRLASTPFKVWESWLYIED